MSALSLCVQATSHFISCAVHPALNSPYMEPLAAYSRRSYYWILYQVEYMNAHSQKLGHCPTFSVLWDRQAGEEQHKCKCRSTQNVFYRNQCCTQCHWFHRYIHWQRNHNKDNVAIRSECIGKLGGRTNEARFQNGSFTPPHHMPPHIRTKPPRLDAPRWVRCYRMQPII